MNPSPDINPNLFTHRWTAHWIAPPGAVPHAFGVYHFRHEFQIAAPPERFVVHVSADNRYQLYVNGKRVCWGPARGDLAHWNYETVDIGPHLHAGRNVLAAIVWNFGEDAPLAQITAGTGFLLQSDTEMESCVDTGRTWKCFRNPSYTPIHYSHGDMRGYFVAGPGERIDGSMYPWGWEQPDYKDGAWEAASALSPGSPRDASDGPNAWMLVPRPIPLMEERPERLESVREAEGVRVPPKFPREPAPFVVAPHTRARVLLDNGCLTTGYPKLTVSGGSGATISLGYAETLFLEWTQHTEKGDRGEVGGKLFHGYRDIFLPDGGAAREFRPLWWRTYRYIVLEIETEEEALTVEDLRGDYTGYPFIRKATLALGAPDVERILEVGWRTARLCAHETYMDCPYYEQLQYVGDTRIQGMISIYMSGDARLLRNAIAQIDQSRTAEGATLSRAPSRLAQYIPSFSLFWIGMLHDYWMYVDDPEFVRRKMPGVRAVLAFFHTYQKENGSLRPLPWWRIIDSTPGWEGGVPPQEADGSSATYDLILLQAYQWAAEMEGALGLRCMSEAYRAAGNRLKSTIQELYWDPSRGLYADTPSSVGYSQHANSLAVLAGLITGADAQRLMETVLSDASLVPCALFFKYYLHAAATRAGLGDRYLDLLGPWHAMLAQGLTTWAEFPDYPGQSSRSDCHAWSAHPNIEMFRTVLGVDSAAPGFKRVRIRPHMGRLTEASGTVPHPSGDIHVRLKRNGAGLKAEVFLPAGLTGEFVWGGQTIPLDGGASSLQL